MIQDCVVILPTPVQPPIPSHLACAAQRQDNHTALGVELLNSHQETKVLKNLCHPSRTATPLTGRMSWSLAMALPFRYILHCLFMYKSTYIYTQTRIHTHTHAYIHTCMHTCKQTDRQAGRQAGRQAQTDTDMCMHACMHAYLHTNTNLHGGTRRRGQKPRKKYYPHKHRQSATCLLM